MSAVENGVCSPRRSDGSHVGPRTERIERLDVIHVDPAEATVEGVLAQQRERWLGGDRVRIEVYLDQCPDLQQSADAFALIYGEFLLREELGEQPALAEYLERFPRHAELLEQQVRLHRALASVAPMPERTERTYLEFNAPQDRPKQAEQSGASCWPTVEGFEILCELGRGGMGVVYKARQLGLNRIVALKMIKGGCFADSASQARFRSEAEVIAQLQHSNIVQIFTIGTQHSPLGEALACPYFAEEYVDGGSLSQRLAGKPQPPRDAACFVAMLARAVHYAHEHGIVHRDLKPGNILLQRLPERDGARRTPAPGVPPAEPSADPHPTPVTNLAGEALVPWSCLSPKISDFGLAKQLQAAGDSRTVDGCVLGTPEYMAPEQVGGAATVGPPADIYALGVILYEMVTGRIPFEGASPLETLEQVRVLDPVPPSRLQPKTPRDLETICLKCLQKDARKRYASAADLADDLQRFLQGEPIHARPVGVIERGWRWARRRPAVAVLSALVVLILIGSVCGLTAAWFHALTGWLEADRQRLQALIQKTEADEQRQRAEDEQTKAERRREETLDTLYFTRIAQAGLEGRLSNFASATRALELCQPEPGGVDRRGWEWHYLLGTHHADLLTVSPAHLPCVASVDFSPDGQLLLTAGGSPFGARPPDRVRVWRLFGAEAGAWLQEFPHPRMVSSARWIRGGRAAVWSGADSTVAIGDLDTGQIEVDWELPNGFNPATFSGDGRRCASSNASGQVRLWDVDTGLEVFAAKVGDSHGPYPLALSPDGERLAIWFGTLRLWETRPPRELRTFPEAHNGHGQPAFSPDGRLLALGTTKGMVRIWDTETGKLVQSLSGHEGAVQAITFSADGRSLATAGADQTVRLCNVQSGTETLVLRGHQGRVTCVAFHPSGRFLASGSEQPGDVKLWDVTRQQDYVTVGVAPERTGYLEAIGFDDSSKTLRLITGGGWLHSNRADTGAPLGGVQVDFSHEWIVPSFRAAFRGDGRQLASVSTEDPCLVKLIETTGGEVQHRLEHPVDVLHLTYSRDGRRLATSALPWRKGDDRRVITVWDSASGQQLTTVSANRLSWRVPHGVAALSTDGRLLAYDDILRHDRGEAVVVRIRDLTTGQERMALNGLVSVVRCLAFSSTGRYLAIATDGQGVLIYDCQAEHWLHPEGLSGSEAETKWDVDFSPDGRRLAAVGRSQVHIWDVVTGQTVLVLRGAPPRSKDGGFNPRVVWSPDGHRLAASNWNRTVSIWDAAPRHTPEAKQAMHQAAEGRTPLR